MARMTKAEKVAFRRGVSLGWRKGKQSARRGRARQRRYGYYGR